jgi:hypothetical protein
LQLNKNEYNKERIVTDKFRYKHLYELQDSLIEHKEPNDNGNVSYFIEAAGDIFRELTLDHPDRNYIREKIRKLDKFKELTIGDIDELKHVWVSRPAYKGELLDYLKKVNQLADGVDKTNCFCSKAAGDDIDKKEQMLRALAVIETLIDFGMFGSRKAEDNIERLKKSFHNEEKIE